MKIKYFLLFIIMGFGSNFLLAQHENDNWRFGNNKWNFNTSLPIGFTHVTNLSPNIRYGASVISDKNTGELLFYCDGYKIYNKNNAVMSGGDHLFGSPINSVFNSTGNPSDQSSIIVPVPNSQTEYYVFYINGNRVTRDQSIYGFNVYNYGLRYAKVNMSLNGGLGSVTSSNNILFTNPPTTPPVDPFDYDNSTTNALTSTFGSDGKSYWIVTAKDGNILSYKLDANGLNTTPVSSPALYGSFLKISPDSKKLFTRKNIAASVGGVYLADFNNITGIVTNQSNIIPSSLISKYTDIAFMPNSAEFSPDSNIVYFVISGSVVCCGIVKSGIAMYNISTGELKGYDSMLPAEYVYPIVPNGATGELQRAVNGKIYMIINSKGKTPPGESAWYEPVIFGNTIGSTYYSYNWQVINTPNVWNPSTNPLAEITPPAGTINGFSFPQLIPSLVNVSTCPDNLDITTQVTVSQNFQAGQHITASSGINNGLIVNYKAGKDVTLLPGFNVKATEASLFKAYIGPCDRVIENFAKNSNSSESYSKEIKTTLTSEVKIYPNPTSNYININSGNEKLVSWEMYDMSGKAILRGITTPIDIQNMIKGSYLLKINLEKRQVSKMVIVK